MCVLSFAKVRSLNRVDSDVNTTVVVHGGHPLIYMTDGTRCPNAGDMAASTVIRFICDASAGAGMHSGLL